MSKEKETTALSPSVGADGGQPSKTYTSIITEKEEEFNENFSHSQDFFRKPQWDRGQNTQADGQPTVMLLKPCRASSRREEFGLLGRQSDWKKAAPGKRTGEITSLFLSCKKTSRRPSGIGGTPNRPWVGKEFSSLRDPVLPFVPTESKIKYKIDYNRVSCEGG